MICRRLIACYALICALPFPACSGTSIRIPCPRPSSNSEHNVDDIRLLGTKHLHKPVLVHGVLSSVHHDEIDYRWNWFVLRTKSGNVHVAVNISAYSLQELQSLVDAEVDVMGVPTRASSYRRAIWFQLQVEKAGSLIIRKAPPKEPFTSCTHEDMHHLHRKLLQGVVVAAGNGRFFLRSNDEKITQVHLAPNEIFPPNGASIKVLGFTTDNTSLPLVSDAIVQIIDSTKHHHVAPKHIDESLLFSHNTYNGRITKSLHKSFITIRGTVLAHPTNPSNRDTLILSCNKGIIPIEIAAVREKLDKRICLGCKLEVSGLCIADSVEQPHLSHFPTFQGYSIIPCKETDVRIVEMPPWWTPARLFAVIISFFSVIVAILIWNVSLKRHAEQKGKELYKEKLSHAIAEQKIEERTRLAVELHDSISQTLTGVALQLDGGEIEDAKTLLASCRSELRRCLWDLRSRTFEEKDMTEAVQRTISPHLNGCKAIVRFNVPRNHLSESITHTTLQIIRELTVNAVRHGQSKNIRIAGEIHATTISFSVKDDGLGFDSDSIPGPESGHFGILGIRERIAAHQGTLEIVSTQGIGSKFTVTMRTGDNVDEY